MPIERLPFFGTTWYRRGVAYWSRRALLSSLLLVALAGATLMLVGFVSGIEDRSIPIALRVVIYGIVLAAVVRSFIKGFQALISVERKRRAGEHFDAPDAMRSSRSRRAGWHGAGSGAATVMGSASAGASIVLTVIGYYGWIVVWFLFTLRPEYGAEHNARLRLEQWKRANGHADMDDGSQTRKGG
jgi:hypothetical protein